MEKHEFVKERDEKKAIRKIQKDSPLLIIGSPMHGLELNDGDKLASDEHRS